MSDKKPASGKGEKKKGNRQMILAVGIPILLSICIPYIYYAVTINAFAQENQPAGYRFPKYEDFWKTIVGAIVCQTMRAFIVTFCYPLFYQISKVQDDEELRVKYATKAVKNLYQVLYFSCSAFWGWSVLKDTQYLPWYLGGQVAGADYTKMDLSTIYTVYDQNVYEYSLYTFGYHFGNFFQHMFIDEHENDFEEMLIHHIAAFSLYFSYIFGNQMQVGAVMAFLHDLADIPGSASKFLNSTTFQDSSAVAFVTCMIVWFGTRIVVLPQVIYFIFTGAQYGPDFIQFQPFLILNGVFLSVMCALHYMWFAMFFKILYKYIIFGEASDEQNKVSKASDAKASSPGKRTKAEKLE